MPQEFYDTKVLPFQFLPLYFLSSSHGGLEVELWVVSQLICLHSAMVDQVPAAPSKNKEKLPYVY